MEGDILAIAVAWGARYLSSRGYESCVGSRHNSSQWIQPRYPQGAAGDQINGLGLLACQFVLGSYGDT